MLFRRGGPDDVPALTRVLLEAFASYAEWAPAGWSPSPTVNRREAELLVTRLGWPDAWCLVAESDGEAAGYVVFFSARSREPPQAAIDGLAHLWHLFVRPPWWGSGVATRLLGDAMSEASRRGYRSARLWTPGENARARAFYRREGWRESGERSYAPDLDLELIKLVRDL